MRRLTQFSEESLAKALKRHERHAAMLIALDQKVADVVQKLKAKGFVSPYLKSFVVACSNPLRVMKEPPELEDLMNTIRAKVERSTSIRFVRKTSGLRAVVRRRRVRWAAS